MATEACNTISRAPLRHRILNEIQRAKDQINYYSEKLEKAEKALKTLDKNKELETLIDLVQF